MFNFTHPLPQKYWVACSGGIDSMSALHFLRKPLKNGLMGVVHINHGTAHAPEAERFVRSYCKMTKLPVMMYRVPGSPPKGESKECWWRDQRYGCFNAVPGDAPIILAHNFDDCLEEYLMCVMVRGYQGTIPYSHGRCVRPFRLWKKENIRAYAERESVLFTEDPSNADTKFKRNYIRKHIVPHALKINPGLYKIVKRVIDE